VQIIPQRSYQRDFIADIELVGWLPLLATIGAHQAVVRRAEGSGANWSKRKTGNVNFHQHSLKRKGGGVDDSAALSAATSTARVHFRSSAFLLGRIVYRRIGAAAKWKHPSIGPAKVVMQLKQGVVGRCDAWCGRWWFRVTFSAGHLNISRYWK
jgi:hypothetical protein